MTVLAVHSSGQPAVQYVDADPDRWEVLADRLKAVADPTRLRLLDAVRSLPQQRGCVSQITAATGLPQPTVSRHLQVLHRAALLHRTRHGSRTFYQLSNQALESVARDLATPRPL
jgi:ArsR family transcriptional regulator